MSGVPHTSGPWSVYEGDPLIIVNAEGSSLGEMSSGDPFISYAQMKANAAVAAIGPEAVALLERLIEITPHRTLDPSAPLYRSMVELLAKSRGAA